MTVVQTESSTSIEVYVARVETPVEGKKRKACLINMFMLCQIRSRFATQIMAVVWHIHIFTVPG